MYYSYNDQSDNSVAGRLSKLIARFDELEKKYNDFKSAVDHAYDNQSPPKTDETYHIQPQDFLECETQQNEFNEHYRILNVMLDRYCIRGPIPESEKSDLKEAFRSYGEKAVQYNNFIKREMGGSLYGIAYCVHYPSSEDRRRYEHNYEAMLNQQIMFGFSM